MYRYKSLLIIRLRNSIASLDSEWIECDSITQISVNIIMTNEMNITNDKLYLRVHHSPTHKHFDPNHDPSHNALHHLVICLWFFNIFRVVLCLDCPWTVVSCVMFQFNCKRKNKLRDNFSFLHVIDVKWTWLGYN